MHNQSDFGYAIPAFGGEVQWSRDYWAAKALGDLATAFSIAYAHREDFDWDGDYPSDWSQDEVEEHSLAGRS